MNQSDVKVSFYLKKSEADEKGRCPVMARLTVGRYSETAFSLKMSAPKTMWNSGRATGKSVAARVINRRLDEIRVAALSVFQEQTALHDVVTAHDIKHILLGMASCQESLMSYFRNFIDKFEKRVGVNRTASSLKSYRLTYRHVEKFLNEKHRLTDIPFTALDCSFIDRFDIYLRTERNLALGTIKQLTTNFRTIIGEASFYYAFEAGADIISCSWHCDSSPAITNAINYVSQNGRNGLGCPIFFTSGNDNKSFIYYPASLPNTIAVGAMTPNGERKKSIGFKDWGSNHGEGLDVVAPGIYIPTTTTGGYIDNFSGTSAACPHAASAILINK